MLLLVAAKAASARGDHAADSPFKGTAVSLGVAIMSGLKS